MIDSELLTPGTRGAWRQRFTHMKWRALATDFDGTIATDAVVDEPTLAALGRLRSANVRTLLVTGRHLTDFESMGSFLALFDMVVGENGAVLFQPANGALRTLSPPPPKEFVDELSRRQVSPLGVGHSIVDTREPHHITVLEVIKEQGLELEIIFNKGAVMILPSGVNKASGLQAALQALGLSAETVIGVGDAENDHAFLEICGLPVAVANAVPALKTKAALVTQHSAGAGVTELIESALRGDLDTHVRVAADIPAANTPATTQSEWMKAVGAAEICHLRDVTAVASSFRLFRQAGDRIRQDGGHHTRGWVCSQPSINHQLLNPGVVRQPLGRSLGEGDINFCQLASLIACMRFCISSGETVSL